MLPGSHCPPRSPVETCEAALLALSFALCVECCTGLVQWIMWHFSCPACRRSSGTGLRPLSYEEKTKVCMYISKLFVSPLLTSVCACTYSIHSMDVRCVL